MKPVILRVLIYLVLIPLAVVVVVPNGFDTLHLLATGKIAFSDVAPDVARAFDNLTKTREIAVSGKRADRPLTDLGNGAYALADSEWAGKRSGTQMEGDLNAQATRFCATRQGKLHVTHSSNYNSKGYNDADLAFWCEGTVAANQVGELANLEAELIKVRDRVADTIDTLDEPLRKPSRDKLHALGYRNMEVRKLSGEQRLRRTRDMIALHAALLREVAGLKSNWSGSTQHQPMRTTALC